MSPIQARFLKAAVALVLAFPFLALLQEALVVLISGAIYGLFRSPVVAALAQQMVTSPVHAQLMVDTAGAVQPQGLAVAGLPGAVLHGVLPSLFSDPNLVSPGAWVSAVVARDSSVMGLFLTGALVRVLLIVAGGMLVWRGAEGRPLWELGQSGRPRRLVLAAAGILLQAHAIAGLFQMTRSPGPFDLHDTGIGFALSILWRVEAEQYIWLMDTLLPRLIPSVLAVFGLAQVSLAGRLLDRARLASRVPRGRPAEGNRSRLMRIALPLSLASLLLLAPASGSWFGLARTSLVPFQESPPEARAPETPLPPYLADPDKPAAEVNLLPAPVEPDLFSPASDSPTGSAEAEIADSARPTAVRTEPGRDPAPPARWGSSAGAPAARITPTPNPMPVSAPTLIPPATPLPAGISRTSIAWTPSGLGVTLNDRPTMMVGMNYNADYTTLPLERKRSLHHRDFRTLRDAGINAVIGWGVYDAVTLQVAQEYGVGVIMPFELDPQGPFWDGDFRAKTRGDYRAFVNRFRAMPAVWGWNPGGDELLHRMETEHHRTRDQLQAAADLLLELGELGYLLDPSHVEIIKDARDSYLPYLERSIQAARAQRERPNPSQYLVYAANLYGRPDDVAGALLTARRNVQTRLGVAFLVGEYAPFGLARQDRPTHYGMLWDIVAASSRNGGFAYVYGPDQPNFQGPNPYDPLRLLVNDFSMVDSDGRAVDDTLALLSARWHRASQGAAAP